MYITEEQLKGFDRYKVCILLILGNVADRLPSVKINGDVFW